VKQVHESHLRSRDSLVTDLDKDIWRNTPRGRRALEISAKASYDGRGHRKGEPAPLYGGYPQPVVDDEFLHTHPFRSGTEIRSTRLTGHLLAVDGTQDAIAVALGTTVAQLSNPDDRSICQRITRELFAEGFQALWLPSARAITPGAIVIIEHSAALELLREEDVLYRTITKRPKAEGAP
jgi:hypothetical protein